MMISSDLFEYLSMPNHQDASVSISIQQLLRDNLPIQSPIRLVFENRSREHPYKRLIYARELDSPLSDDQVRFERRLYVDEVRYFQGIQLYKFCILISIIINYVQHKESSSFYLSILHVILEFFVQLFAIRPRVVHEFVHREYHVVLRNSFVNH